MPSRRKIDWAALHAPKPANPDDNTPWFLTRHFAPPLWREVRAIWPDGLIAGATRTGEGWTNDLWSIHRVARQQAPVGWKPWRGVGGIPNWGDTRTPLPDPLKYGIQVTS
jgi:hypothetical protein